MTKLCEDIELGVVDLNSELVLTKTYPWTSSDVADGGTMNPWEEVAEIIGGVMNPWENTPTVNGGGTGDYEPQLKVTVYLL